MSQDTEINVDELELKFEPKYKDMNYVEERLHYVKKLPVKRLSKYPDRVYIVKQIQELTSARDIFLALRWEFLQMENEENSRFRYEDLSLMSKLSYKLTGNCLFWKKSLQYINTFFDNFENYQIPEVELMFRKQSKPCDKMLISAMKKVKKIQHKYIQEMSYIPEYRRALSFMSEEFTDSSIFLSVRAEALKRLSNNLIKGRPANIIKSISKNLFDDPDFWQKPDEEVFARINEMRERGEID